MNLTEYILMLLKGLGSNLLVTFIASLLLIMPGILLTFLSKKFPLVGKIFGWLSVPFECICPIIFFMAFYWGIISILYSLDFSFNLPTSIGTLLCLIIAYMGYMPARYTQEYSFLKNILYNGLGMISAIFKWSFCAHVIGFTGLYFMTGVINRSTYRIEVYWIPLIVSFLLLLVIEIARRIIKQFMK